MDRLFRTSSANITKEDYASSPVKKKSDWVVAIKRAEYAGDYSLQIEFDDGKKVKVDFSSFLNESLNPLIKRYLDLEEFKKYSLDYGDLQWNDYDLCFPVADLYEGRI